MKKILEFTYNLRFEEIYESFLLLNKKCGKKMEKVLVFLLTIIAVVLLIGYYMDNRRMHFFVLAILDIILLFYLIYVPEFKAKSVAKKLCRQKGKYKVKITDEGTIVTETETIDIKGDKDARTVETENIFVIRPDNMHTLCLPKRILTEDEMEDIREILKANMKFVRQ